jgi:hypothetical protein
VGLSLAIIEKPCLDQLFSDPEKNFTTNENKLYDLWTMSEGILAKNSAFLSSLIHTNKLNIWWSGLGLLSSSKRTSFL